MMFRTLRWAIGVIALAAAIYGAVRVDLGGRTLWGHLRAIANTAESQELVDGLRQKAAELTTDARTGPRSKPEKPLSRSEREQLRELIRERVAKK